MIKKSFLLLVVIVLALPGVWSLFHPGFFPSHDGEWMVIRLSDFHRSFLSGQIPVRWGGRLNFGHGYPVFNFLYPLPFYLGELFYFFTSSFVNSIKLVFISSFFLSGVFIYLWVREHWGDLAGLLSAAFYVYTPYRFLDVYVRGSLGEALAFIFPPIIFLMSDKVAKKGNKLHFLIGGLAFAGLITAHNTMAMLFVFLFLGYLGFQWCLFRQKKAVFRQLLILIWGIGLASFFWLPALYDKRFVYFDKVMVSNFFLHFPTLRQLLVPSWGFSPSLPLSDQETLSFQVGAANLLILIIMIVVFGLKLFRSAPKRVCLKKDFRVYYFLLAFILSFFLMLGISFWIWKILFVYNLIQFPWRLLSLTTFSSAFLAGALVQLVKGHLETLLVVGSVAGVILLTYSYAKPEYFIDRGEAFYATNEATTTVADEYMPIWVKQPATSRAEKKTEILIGEGEISNLIFNSKKINFEIEAKTDLTVQVNVVYFPGWQVEVDDQPIKVDYENPRGLIQFETPSGQHRVLVEFKETPVRLFADLISLMSLMVVFGWLVKKR